MGVTRLTGYHHAQQCIQTSKYKEIKKKKKQDQLYTPLHCEVLAAGVGSVGCVRCHEHRRSLAVNVTETTYTS